MRGLRSDITALQIDDKEKRWTLMRKGKGESDECREVRHRRGGGRVMSKGLSDVQEAGSEKAPQIHAINNLPHAKREREREYYISRADRNSHKRGYSSYSAGQILP